MLLDATVEVWETVLVKVDGDIRDSILVEY